MAKSAKGPEYEVKIVFAGGLTASSRRMLGPLSAMFHSYAIRVRDRITKERRLPNGKMTGFHTRIKKKIDQLTKDARIYHFRYRTTGALIYRAKELAALEMRDAKRRGGRKSRRNYSLRGGMWRGLKVKVQKSGQRITLGFYGRSKSKSKWRDEANARNLEKAWGSMLTADGRRQREGVHLLGPSKAELQTLGSTYHLKITLDMLNEIAARQQVAKMLKRDVKVTKDPKLKAMLDRFMKT